jgi:putative hemolysin
MSIIASEIIIIVLLVLANGLFAMSELAIISCRKSQLRKLAEHGDSRAKAALELADSPNRFLSTVQMGITLIGVLAGAFGGVTIAGEIAGALEPFPFFSPYGEAIGIGIVVLGITLLSVVLGELVPKRLALNNPLGISLILARPIRRLSRLTSPVVRLLGALTDVVLKLFGFRPTAESAVTEDEVRLLVEQGHEEGVFFEAEKEMVKQAMALDRKRVGDIMTPRAQIVWLNVADSNEVNWPKIIASGHSYFPVFEGKRDNVLGVVSLKGLWANFAAAKDAGLSGLVAEPLFVPANMTALKLLETFKQSRNHLALVSDEFGTVQGIVTIVDVFEEIVGDIPSFDEAPQARAVRRGDGSWLVDASLELDELKQLLGVQIMPGEDEEAYQTLSGFVLYRMQRIPREGDYFVWGNFRFEVADVDRHRLDKIIIQQQIKPVNPNLRNESP